VKSLGESFLVTLAEGSTIPGIPRPTIAWKTESPYLLVTVSFLCGPQLLLTHAPTGLALTSIVPADRFKELQVRALDFSRLPLKWEESDVEKFLLGPFELSLADYRRFLELAGTERLDANIQAERERRKKNIEMYLERMRAERAASKAGLN
jgi:hypothetical protein